MVPILKMRRFSCLLRLSLPPEMGEMAQTFISEIEWLTALKCRATGLSTSLFLTEREQEKVPPGACRFCLRALRTKLSRMFLLRLKEVRGLSVKMADVSGSFLRI